MDYQVHKNATSAPKTNLSPLEGLCRVDLLTWTGINVESILLHSHRLLFVLSTLSILKWIAV